MTRPLTSNTFELSENDIRALEEEHEYRIFLDCEATELWLVAEEDDLGEDRTIYGFGSTCPLPIADSHSGGGDCKAFKKNFYGCRSCISESVARNYLAKHAFGIRCSGSSVSTSEFGRRLSQ